MLCILTKKIEKRLKKCFNQLLVARSTQKLVKIHNSYESNLRVSQSKTFLLLKDLSLSTVVYFDQHLGAVHYKRSQNMLFHVFIKHFNRLVNSLFHVPYPASLATGKYCTPPRGLPPPFVEMSLNLTYFSSSVNERSKGWNWVDLFWSLESLKLLPSPQTRKIKITQISSLHWCIPVPGFLFWLFHTLDVVYLD